MFIRNSTVLILGIVYYIIASFFELHLWFIQKKTISDKLTLYMSFLSHPTILQSV